MGVGVTLAVSPPPSRSIQEQTRDPLSPHSRLERQPSDRLWVAEDTAATIDVLSTAAAIDVLLPYDGGRTDADG
jgi:hypothetical protein